MTAPLLDALMSKLSDFADFRDISENTDGPRLNGYIREAQRQEIRNFLGKELYLAMQADYSPDPVDDFTEQRFKDLWFGVDTTIKGRAVRFSGLKPALIYYSYERFVYNNAINVTRYGNRILEDGDLSANAEFMKQYRVSADSMGLSYQNDADEYLNAFRSLYPEWTRPGSGRADNTGFKMFKVGKLIGR